jgi:PAS domain S-box-containing protein
MAGPGVRGYAFRWWPVILLVAYTAGIDLLISARWGRDAALMTSIGAWGAIPAVALALCFLVALVLRHPMALPRKRAWLCLASAFAFILTGSAIWAFQVSTHTDEVGGLGDLIYWCSFPLTACAMLLFFRDVGGSLRQPSAWLDTATLAIAVGVAMWEFVVRPSLLATTGDPGSAIAASVYAGTFVLTAALGGLVYMQVTDWRDERALALLAAAMLSNVLAECFSGGETPTTLLATLAYNTAYLAADILVIAAVIVEGGRDDVAARARIRPAVATSALPAVAVLLAVAMLIMLHVGMHNSEAVVTLTIALLGALLVAAREISTRYELYKRHRDRAMRAAEERLTELIRRSRDVIAIVGPDGRLSYVSPAAERVLEHTPGELVGQLPVALVGAANAARMSTFLQVLNAGDRGSSEVDFEILLPSGERRIVGVVGSDERSSAIIGGIALTLRDATFERRAERAMLDGATRERQALSGEIHEGVAQDLAGISLLIKSLRKSTAPNDDQLGHDLQTALDELGRTIGNVRRLATTLAPVHVARGSLPLAVQNLAMEASARTGMRVTARSSVADRALAETLSEDAYRMIHDTVACATRDSTCTFVDIALELGDATLTITLECDGNGLTPDRAANDELLRTVAHRVQRLRGTLQVEQPAVQRIRVVVQLPTGSPGESR